MICAKCKRPFPCFVIIEGKQRNLGNRKYCLECSPFKSHNTGHPDHETLPEIKTCKRCGIPKSKKEFYTRRKGTSLFPYCITCVNNDATNRQRDFKLRAIEYKGGSCIICGYNSCAAAMDFHHVNPNEKDFLISKYWSSSFKKVTAELDKCVLLCSRCHREVEDGHTRLPKVVISVPLAELESAT